MRMSAVGSTVLITASLAASAVGPAGTRVEATIERTAGEQDPKPDRTVRGRMQPRPGAPEQDVEVGVHQVPTHVPSVRAEARLADDELVLGVVLEGTAIAYPVRYLAMHEVINSEVGDTAVAPTW